MAVTQEEGQARLWVAADPTKLEVEVGDSSVCGRGPEWCMLAPFKMMATSENMDDAARKEADAILADASRDLEQRLTEFARSRTPPGEEPLEPLWHISPEGPQLLLGRHVAPETE